MAILKFTNLTILSNYEIIHAVTYCKSMIHNILLYIAKLFSKVVLPYPWMG